MTEPSLIEQAIIEHWGERCPEYEPGCHACEAWKEYDAMTEQNQSPVVTDEVERVARAVARAGESALLEAEQRGRRMGMEEAAKVAEEYGDGGLEYDIEPEATVATSATSRMITDAIRAKMEVQK